MALWLVTEASSHEKALEKVSVMLLRYFTQRARIYEFAETLKDFIRTVIHPQYHGDQN
jgi:hypothetical protein